VVGAVFGVGAVSIAFWWLGAGARLPRLRASLWRRLAGAFAGRSAVAVSLALVVLLMTRWPVAAVLTAAAGALLPDFLGRDPIRVEIERLRALSDWAQGAAELMTTGAGVGSAVATSAADGRGPIRAHLHELARGKELSLELRRFAECVNDGRCDVLVDLLLLAGTGKSGGVAGALRHVAAELRDDADALDGVREDRAQMRGEARGVAIAALAILAALVALSPAFVAPLGTPGGQVALAASGTGMLVGLWLLARMSRREPPARFRPPDMETVTW
jgi:Flp pilus assembly protein TadB